MIQHILRIRHNLALIATLLPCTPLSARDSFADSAKVLHPDTIVQRAYSVSSADEAESSPLQSVLPPSPQASALARYGEYPVSHATGVPDITIPLYEIRLGGFTLPISLSYHASGIKADEVATSVGLGWTLNAGGAIVRSVRGLPDLQDAGTVTRYFDTTYRSYDRCMETSKDIDALWKILPFGDRQQGYDTESDRYAYNFCGKSGIFVYSLEDSAFVSLNRSCMNIEAIGGYESSFSISDTDGTIYHFGQCERSGILDDEGHTEVSAWYLTKVTTVYGDIFLRYRNYGFAYVDGVSCCKRIGQKLRWTEYGSVETIPASVNSGVYGAYTRYCHEQVLLSEIEWRGNKIEFNYETNREDFGTARLVKIDILDYASNITKSVVLDNGLYAGNVSVMDNVTYSSKRMLLRSVSLSGEGTYTFSYDTTVTPPYYPVNGTFPTGHRHGTDYWGYYNGPKVGCGVPYNVVRDAYYVFCGKDAKCADFAYPEPISSRLPNLEYAKMLMLKGITYPTGGTTTLAYELNTPTGKVGGLRIREMRNGDEVRTYTYVDDGISCNVENLMWSNHVMFYCGNFAGHGFARYIECSDTPQFPYNNVNTSLPFYDEVVESFLNGERIEYRYNNGALIDTRGTEEPPSDGDIQPSPMMSVAALNDMGNIQPLLREKSYYGSDGTCVRSESFHYDEGNGRKITTGTRVYCPIANLDDVRKYYLKGNFRITQVELGVVCHKVHGWVNNFNLISKYTKDFTTGTVTRTEYTYDIQLRTLLPKTTIITNSDGKTFTNEIVYAFDTNDSLHCRMVSDYLMYDTPVEQKRYCNGQLLERTTTEFSYNKECDWFFPRRLIKSFNGNTPYETYRFCDYDSHGNLTKLMTDGTDTDSIVWGYNGMHPVAHFHNGTLQREYAWKPLVGVSSVREPNGYLHEYGYDAAGRLSSVGDASGTSQEYDYRYVHGFDGETSGSNSVQTVEFLSSDKTHQTNTLQYCDGLGRPFDKSTDSASEDGTFLHSIYSYDARGRQSRQWLPIVSAVGEPVSKDNVRELSRDTYGDTMAYSDTEYDAVDRPVYTSTAGEAWKGKGKAVERIGNGERDVRLFHAPLDRVSLVDDGYYKPATLFGERTTDEDGHSLTTFTDRLGRKVLERRNDGKANNDTYFVYNDLGQLRYVLSPEYQHSGYKDKYAYEYRYDGRGNVVKRILPGCEYTQYWYDRANRMSFMQDATLRERGRYRFFLYDRLGRLAVQGTCTACDRGEQPNMVEFSEKDDGICNTNYKVALSDKITNPNLEMVNYYDSYDFMSGYAPVLGNAIGDFRVSSACAKGLPTGSVQVASDGARLLSVFFYDFKGRITDTRRLLEGKRLTATHTEYSYTGKPTRTETKEYDMSAGKRLTVTQVLENEYSTKTDRLLSTTFTVNGKKQTIQRLEYDRLGRICRVTRGGDVGAVSYGYNLHGWTISIGSKDFSEELHYADGVGTPCHNGNVSSMVWKTPDSPRKRGYTFSYDTLDRLREAVYGEDEDLSDKRNRYDEKVVEYTANGAIKRFQRRGRKDNGEYGKIDNLSIKLDGNQLLSVTDDALPANRYSSMNFIDGADERREYTYNGVGAMTSDLNRGMTSVEYDELNNPKRILFDDGTEISYTYLPDGTKLEKSFRVAGLLPQVTYTTEYSGDVIYRNGKLDKVLFQGGYCTFERGSDTPTFHYFTQDHLGNNRAVTNENGTLEQITHYYPFGGTFNDAGLNPELQQHKYNGKELDRTAGLNTYDYGARQYFPILPMWDRMDPLCEEDYRTSPYAYCKNNPIKFIDEDGRKIVFASGSTNTFKQHFMQAIDFLSLHNCDNLYQMLEKDAHVFIVKEGSKSDSFSYKESTIEWNPTRGLYTGFTTLSPTVLLNHEFDHAVEWLKSPTTFIEKIKILPDDDVDADYHTRDDKRVIEGSERETAYKLGEIYEGEITRNGHGGIPVKTSSPTSRKTFDEIPEPTIIYDEDKKN